MSSHSVANREEALKCCSIAEKAMARGDFEKAVRLASKAKRMAPENERAARLLTRAREAKRESEKKEAETKRNASPPYSSSSSSSTSGRNRTSGGRTSNATNATNAETKRRRPKTSSSSAASGESDAEACKRINSCNDYYKILQVPRNADSKMIRKRYRLLARKFHPDKNNNSPEYTEAFKAIGQAYDTLIDETKRANYDRYGTDDPSANPRAQYARQHRNQFRAADDIFAELFGGVGGVRFGRGMHPMFVRQRHRGRNMGGQGNREATLMDRLIQFLPLLMIVLMSWVSVPDSSYRSRPYGWSRSGEYPVGPIKTSRREIPYFVPESTATDLRRDRYYKARMDGAVEEQHMRRLQRKCSAQKKEKRRIIRQAERSGGRDRELKERLMKRAHEFRLESCEDLNRLYGGNPW